MKLIVGLGNPGRKYDGTRHNIGFEVIAELARRHGVTGFRKAFQAEAADCQIGGERMLLMQPQTFMNRSGLSVVEARDFYKITNADLLVLCDDLNLPFGKLRMRAAGSAGGQKGLLDVIRCCGDDKIPRLRIGIGQQPDRMDAADFVLAKFTAAEKTEMGLAVVTAADAAELWVASGVAACMNRYN